MIGTQATTNVDAALILAVAALVFHRAIIKMAIAIAAIVAIALIGAGLIALAHHAHL